MRAAYRGKLEIVRYLIERGVDINNSDNNSITALHHAVESESVDIIKLLPDKEMSINLTNTYNNTPLHVSAEF